MADHKKKYLDFTRQPDFKDILTNPILDIAARFWEDDRYDAFRVCYRSMRVVDDLVDDRKVEGAISAGEKNQIAQAINGWLGALNCREATDDFLVELLDTMNRFCIPVWPFSRLSTAMLYDLDHDGFRSFLCFLRYTEGAAIAPASIFMHLCGVNRADHVYTVPEFDIRKAARPLAVFSYLVHIIRDFEKDQKRGLNYFADDLLKRCGLGRRDLTSVAEGGSISTQFRQLMAMYKDFATYYQGLARKTVDVTRPYLEPQYQLSLEIIYSLYSQIFERIDTEKGNFSGRELNPTPDEVQDRIYATVSMFRPIN